LFVFPSMYPLIQKPFRQEFPLYPPINTS